MVKVSNILQFYIFTPSQAEEAQAVADFEAAKAAYQKNRADLVDAGNRYAVRSGRRSPQFYTRNAGPYLGVQTSVEFQSVECHHSFDLASICGRPT